MTHRSTRALGVLSMAGLMALAACGDDATSGTATSQSPTPPTERATEPTTTNPEEPTVTTEPTTAADVVIAATTELFGARDLTAIDRYFGPTYTQHSTLAADGLDGLRQLASSLTPEFRYEPARVIAEGDLVVTHGMYHGFGPDPLVGFDVWRVADGRIVEHWDSLTPVVTDTASGRTQTDGKADVTDVDQTEANKAIVTEFAQKVLVGADYTILADYISTERYDQHNPEAADGLAGFGAAAERWAADGKLLVYSTVHQVIASGDFVFTRSEGTFGEPVIYADLWRLEHGRIVEHWDVITPIPAQLPHDNGVF